MLSHLFFLYHHLPLTGVKGRVQSRTVEKDGKTEYLMEIIAEKITFLSNKKGDEKADE